MLKLGNPKMLKMIDLSSKIALVTGGGRGIGRAITLALVQAGASLVYITYKDDPASAWDTVPLGIDKVLPLHCDVTQQQHCRMVAQVIRELGSIDILVNNAGINRPSPFDEITLEDWVEVLDVNLTGSFLVTQALLPVIKDGGSIVFMGSVSGYIGGKVSSHYCASKAGVSALAANIGLFAAPRGIRVNCVAPGYVRSPLTDKGAENPMVRDTIKAIPMGRLAEPEEIANIVCFLASNMSSYITCQTIHVNGGLYF